MLILPIVNIYLISHITLYELVEGLPDVVTCLGTCLFEGQVVLNTEVYNLFLSNCSFLLSRVDQVALIGYYYFRHFVLDLLLYVIQPQLQILKGFPLSDVEHYYCAVTFAVVRTSNRHVLLCSS